MDAQVLDRAAPLGDGPRGHGNGFVEALHGLFRAPVKHVARGLHLDQRSLKALQQRIVQLPRDAHPLLHAPVQLRAELPPDLIEPQPVQPPEHGQKGGHARRVEPSGLIVRRRDGELQRIAGFVPDAAVIAGDDAEAVLAGRKTCIYRSATISAVLPVPVLSLQLVLETDLLRRDEAQGRVTNFQAMGQRRQPPVRSRPSREVLPNGLVVGGDLLDVHRRRELVGSGMERIDHADDSVAWKKPQPAVRR